MPSQPQLFEPTHYDLYEISFTADVLQAKQRPRFNAKERRTYTPTETTDAERQIAIAYKGACIRKYGHVVRAPKGVPVAMQVDCYTKAPKKYPDWLPKWLKPRVPFTKKPDWDNLGKTVADGLNEVAYRDDAQITAAHVYKHDLADKGGYIEVTLQFYLPEGYDFD